VKILTLLAAGGLSFSGLKRELGMESSGQLQHHLQKLSGLIEYGEDGSYHLTSVGKRALGIYRESEKSGASLNDLCSVPAPSEMAHDHQISKTGTLLRLSIGSILSALTGAMIGNLLFFGHEYLKLTSGSSSVSLWIGYAVLFGFFGASFLISAVTGYPGCEITALPNLFSRKKKYCSCLITPFNVPNGRLLRQKRQ
jgi:hypothetical protein